MGRGNKFSLVSLVLGTVGVVVDTALRADRVIKLTLRGFFTCKDADNSVLMVKAGDLLQMVSEEP
jgi:hypothetical protein